MRSAAVLLMLLVGGCDSPSLALRNAPARQVTVGQSHFSVHIAGTTAEAIRTNVEFGPGAKGIMARGYTAIELASGCEIVPGTFDGDPALMRAELFCPS